MRLNELLDISGFQDFPFDIRPSKKPQIWAGRKEVLNELKHFADNVIFNHLSEFGILTGSYGSGKSHSLLHVKYVVDEMNCNHELKCLTIYIANPCGLGMKGNFVENYRYIVSTMLGDQKLTQIFCHANNIINNRTSSELEKLPQDERLKITSNDLLLNQKREEVYGKIVGETPIPFGCFLEVAKGDSQALQWIGANPRTAIVAGRGVLKLTSHIICAKALATIIKLATLRDLKGESVSYPAVFILVDQTEDIATLKPGPYQEQIAGWRTLIDETDSNFGLMWAMDGAAEDVSANFTDALQRRQTINPEKLRLLPLTDGESKDFLKQVMLKFRDPKAVVPDDVYPFSEDGLDEIITETVTKTPSYLLMACRTVFTKVAENDTIQSTKDCIDADLVQRYL